MAGQLSGPPRWEQDVFAGDVTGSGEWTVYGLPVRRVHQYGARLSVLGDCLATETELQRGLTAARQGQWRELACWPGSYWSVVDEPERTTVIGDLSGSRPVYLAAQGRAWSTRATPLAEETGAGMDTDALAARLVTPTVPEVVRGRTPYTGIRRVEPGRLVHLTAQGAHTVPYEQDLLRPATNADDTLAEALLLGVRRRVAAVDGQVSGDFSGGMDSTSITLLAARTTNTPMVGVLLIDAVSSNGDDVLHARRAASEEPLIRLYEVTNRHWLFDDLEQAPATDLPFSDACRWATRFGYQRVAQCEGSSLHLTGSAGDLLLSSHPRHLAELARRGEWREMLRQATAWARMRHLPVASTIAAVARASRLSRRAALAQLAKTLGTPAPPAQRSDPRHGLAWAAQGGAAAWLTAEAREQLVRSVRAAAEETPAVPPGATTLMGELHEFGAYEAELRQQVASTGITVHAPFLDNTVVRACMAWPWYRRQNLDGPKRQLVMALQGLVPDVILGRGSKSAYTGSAYAGLRRNADTVRGLVEDSWLAKAGVIDPNVARTDTARLLAGAPGPFAALETLCSTELWIRQHQGAAHA
ncbi:albusnodin/ikarugamycin family macrolactam cyclase [Streptomyces monticola]|uniref:Albusnodin/ikarugamycin family macrolactam cyclase n=1 Tax=Streptomyces monticola TaxID=2666263 RepID=A0ABW2JSL1_9ACTN